jgi:N-acetylglucosaminyldiphosphoundecaprenol N-acetyl-beta-D-mannosaminyltransferase
MGLIHKNILGVALTFSQKDIILKEIEKYLIYVRNKKFKFREKTIKPLIIFTPNPEIISYAQKDNYFKEIVNTAQINLPDGIGIIWAAKKMFGKKIEKISGSDFIFELANLAEKKGYRIGLIGGKGGVALETRECLYKSNTKLKIEVLGEPEIKLPISKLQSPNRFQFSNEQIVKDTAKKIISSDIRILLVALGFPKQEIFIKHLAFNIEHLKLNRPIVLMSVGGSFDYISGKVPRAPLWMRNLGLEWLFRLIREPKRLRRQIRGARFFWDILTS